MDRSYPGPAALTLLSLTPPLTPCAGKIVNVLRVSVCLCVRVCVPMSMQVPVCRADRFRKRTLDSFLYCSLPCCFLRQGFSWSLTFAIFLLDWLARIPKISLCLSPVLGLQTYMANLGVFLEIQTLAFLLKEQVLLLTDPSAQSSRTWSQCGHHCRSSPRGLRRTALGQ